jgi:hypothetical protein
MLMINYALIIVGLLAAAVQISAGKAWRRPARAVEVVLLYLLVFSVGIMGLTGFVGHVFFADQIAAKIGWAAGSPFQFEVGLHDGAWGILGILCIWRRGGFWTATVIGWSFFLLGAGYGHLRGMIAQGNFAPYNAGMILPDLLVPLLLIGALIAHCRLGGAERLAQKLTSNPAKAP